MSRLGGPSSLKRKQPDSNSPSESLTDAERVIYNIIHGTKDMGIWVTAMKGQTNLPATVVNKSINSLKAKDLIKEVKTIQNKGRKHLMAKEFEPSKEIAGGDWYEDGSLDTQLIDLLKDRCFRYILNKKVATLDAVRDSIKESRMFNVDFSYKQIEEILRALILDNEIMEVKSTGFGEFASIPVGRVCYKCTSKGGLRGEPKTGALASIPCGVCPRIGHCTPEGIISPRTCVYFKKWLDF